MSYITLDGAVLGSLAFVFSHEHLNRDPPAHLRVDFAVTIEYIERMEKSTESSYVLDRIADCVEDGLLEYLGFKYPPEVEINGEISTEILEPVSPGSREVLLGCPDGEFEIRIKRIH